MLHALLLAITLTETAGTIPAQAPQTITIEKWVEPLTLSYRAAEGIVPDVKAGAPPATPDALPESTNTDTLAFRAARAAWLDRGGQGGGVQAKAAMGVTLDEGARDVLGRALGEASFYGQRGAGFGAGIGTVVPGTPAKAAGLQAGDVVVRFAGLWIPDWTTLMNLMTLAQPGDEYEAWYLRGGEISRAWVVLTTQADVLALREAAAPSR
jgi:hypothetical protein